MMPGNRRSRLGLERVGKGANSGERIGRSRDESGRGAFPCRQKRLLSKTEKPFLFGGDGKIWTQRRDGAEGAKGLGGMGKFGRKGAETRRAQRNRGMMAARVCQNQDFQD